MNSSEEADEIHALKGKIVTLNAALDKASDLGERMAIIKLLAALQEKENLLLLGRRGGKNRFASHKCSCWAAAGDPLMLLGMS